MYQHMCNLRLHVQVSYVFWVLLSLVLHSTVPFALSSGPAAGGSGLRLYNKILCEYSCQQ